MIRKWLLRVTFLAGATCCVLSPASADSYGYQCFNTLDGVQHCSCTNFQDSASAYTWLFAKLASLQTGDASTPVMAGHSDVAIQTPAANCAD